MGARLNSQQFLIPRQPFRHGVPAANSTGGGSVASFGVLSIIAEITAGDAGDISPDGVGVDSEITSV